MKNLSSANLKGRRLPQLALTLGLLAGAGAAQAQAPTTVYAVGMATQDVQATPVSAAVAAGAQVIAQIDPATQAYVNNSLVTVTGLAAGQQLVGLDARPATGQLYALGYNATTQAARLYLLNPTTGVATPVPNSSDITLNLRDENRSNTQGIVPNVGFDFNPRVDRIRVVAPNGTNYRLNPNNGALAATDGTLAYTAGSSAAGRVPYIGTAAYTNSALGVSGTTLYDIDVANTNGLLSIQNPPNAGTLNPVNAVTFQTNGNATFFSLNSPTIGLDLDIFYNRSSRANQAYLIEARYSDPKNADINNGGTTNQLTTNFWAFDLATGKATGRNIFGRVPLYLANIAVMSMVPKTWTGAQGTAWDNANNWYPVGVPTSTDDVVIPGNGTFVSAANVTVASQPTVSNTGTTKEAASVNLINGAVLTTADGGTLNVYGDFVNNDSQVAGAGTGTVALVSGATQDVGGNATSNFQNLNVAAGTAATTSAGVAITRSVTAGGNLTIGSSQLFTLLSSASGTAYVDSRGSGNISGIATVQRYITPTNAGAGYRHYSSPVAKASGSTTSNTVADLTTAGFTPVVNSAYNSAAAPAQVRPYPTVFAYDQSRLASSNASYAVGDFDNGFFSPTALTDTLSPARGYTVNIPGTALVDFQGKLRNGNYSSGPLARGAQSRAGYHLLGNPYPGAISYTTVYGASSGIQDGLYVYRSSGQYTGSYSTYLSNGQSVNGGTDNVPLAQGFFVRVQAGGSGQVNFTNAARTNAPETAAFMRTASPAPTLALTLRGNGAANQTRVYFDQDATSGYDNARDGFYLPASHGLDLASDLSPEALSINGLPLLAGGATTVPLRLHAPVAGTYILAVDELANLPAGYRAYLRDASTGTYTDLTTTPSVSLALAPGDAPTGRFALLFTAASPLATAPAALAALAAVYPSPAHGTATLVLPQALRGNSASTVQLLNALGQVVLTKTVAPGSGLTVELPLAGIAAGIYTVRATTEAGLVAKRLVVQ